MSHTYTGTAVYHTSITIPDDGDARNASSVNVPLEALQDDVTWLHGRTVLNGVVNFNFNSGASTSVSMVGPSATTGTVATFSLISLGSGVAIGDYVFVKLATTVRVTSVGGGAIEGSVGLQVSDNGGGYVDMPNASVRFGTFTNNSYVTNYPVAVNGIHIQASTGSVAFRGIVTITEFDTTAGLGQVEVPYPWTCEISQLREFTP